MPWLPLYDGDRCRLAVEMLADEHYADQLVERMGWALVDAEQREHAIHA
jgi:hypothetical protein